MKFHKHRTACIAASALVMAMLAASSVGAPKNAGSGDLPPEVQADILRDKIATAVKGGDLRLVMATIDEYKALKVEFPPAYSLVEARAASQTGDGERALAALKVFLAKAERGSESYKEGLALYPKFETDAATARARAKAVETAKAARIRAEAQARIPATLADIAAGMVNIPAGSFRMGDIAGDGNVFEKPVHPVTLRAFQLSKYEVSFDQYDVFAYATGRDLPNDSGWGRGKRPVVNVGWDDAEAFVQWLNSQSGLHYRLPSESEWEYAVRAGTSTVYPWGNSDDTSKRNGAFSVNRTTPVGNYPANAWGLHDMIGNVWEWVQDCFHSDYKGAPADGSAWSGDSSCSRVGRGGSWSGDATWLRVSFRSELDSTLRGSQLGFRLAQDP